MMAGVKGRSGRRREDPEIRFWRYVEVGSRGCLLWMGGLYKGGYGQFWDGEQRVRAHRFAYEQFVGPAGGLFVLHTCDNPRCVNPDHLFLGTNTDNMADMVAKGRAERVLGERNGAAKLTAARVRAARCAYFKYGIPQRQIAKKYGVTPAAINRAIHGRTWGEV